MFFYIFKNRQRRCTKSNSKPARPCAELFASGSGSHSSREGRAPIAGSPAKMIGLELMAGVATVASPTLVKLGGSGRLGGDRIGFVAEVIDDW